MAQRLRVLGLDGKVITRIDTPGKIGHADWSPDGRNIAMISRSIETIDGRPLMVVRRGRRELRDLLPKLEGHVAPFDWRDPSTLLYVADLGTETEVGSVSHRQPRHANMLPRRKLAVTGLDVDDGGVVALVGQTSKHPDELYTLPVAGGEATRRTISNAWLSDLRFAEQEVIRFDARDRLPIEGVLIYPLGYQKGQRYPLMLVVHGGPEAHYRNGWLTVLVSRAGGGGPRVRGVLSQLPRQHRPGVEFLEDQSGEGHGPSSTTD